MSEGEPENRIQISPAYGSLDQYRESTETFTNYLSRVDIYFQANHIKDERKSAIFLASCGPKLFANCVNILSPVEVEKATYKQICDALKTHYTPKSLIIYERFVYNGRFQKPGESIAEYVTALKELIRKCQYPNAVVKDLLRDRFVIGISNQLTQQALLAEDGLTFERCVAIATAKEASIRDSRSARMSDGQETSINHIHRGKPNQKKFTNQSNNRRPSQNKSNQGTSKPNQACFACGGDHWKSECGFKNTICFQCSGRGHIASMCKTKSYKKTPYKGQDKKSRQATNAILEENDLEFVGCVDSPVSKEKGKPLKYTLITQDGNEIVATLDTGTHHSILPKANYLQIWSNTYKRPRITKFVGKLHTFGGHPIDVLGAIQVSIKLSPDGKTVRAEFIVVDQEGPILLGRNLMELLGISVTTDSKPDVCSISKMETFVGRYPDLFAPGLGLYKGKKFSIDVRDDVEPKFFRARPLPYAMRDKVDLELNRLLKEKIIEPVNHSKMAAPIVPVLKPDNSLRLCGDYKVTVNLMVKLDSYPIPNMRDLMAGLSNMKVFSKLDLSQAYAQLELTDKSKPLTMVNTHRGLFQYARLPFGISSAPGIFQRAMENLFQDMGNVICYLDDLLLVSETKTDHERLLNQVFERLQNTGLKLKPEKCEIAVSEVVYLGFKITEAGVLPTQSKVDAIKKAPRPTDLTQLRAYLGLLNFYRRFIPNAASILEPLNRLLKATIDFSWGPAQEEAFKTSKNVLINSEALVHFDQNKPITVQADSSGYGVGAMLAHRIDGEDRPVYFASRTLSETERNYSQTEKEALALVYALKQFHEYLWGQKFTLVTDHKPLLGIFSPKKPISPQASGRVQRWALILQAYNFNLVHRSGKLLCSADALSRLPATDVCENTPVPTDWTNLVYFLDGTPITSAMIKEQTAKDPIMSQVLKYVQTGWPQKAPTNPELTHYSRRKEELTSQDGCILWGTRVVIPPPLRNDVIRELHAVHTGVSKMKTLARSYLWFPNLDKELEEISASCETCLENRPMPDKAELHPWQWPLSPWHRIHVDFAGPIDGNYFLILVDAHSKWVEIFKTKGTATSDVIRCLQHVYAIFGLPVSIVSDNGPCFTSVEFKQFLNKGGVKHVTTAVYKPATNGLAEKMVQTFKNMLRKTKEPVGLAIDRFLFHYRITPHSTTGVSPAELMFGRKLRNKLDLLLPDGTSCHKTVDTDNVHARVQTKQDSQIRNHCRRPRKTEYSVNSKVMARNYGRHGSKWLPAIVTKKTGPVSYRCRLGDGEEIKRHQDQLHTRSDSISPAPPLQRIPNFGGESSATDIVSENVRELPRRSGRPRKPVQRYGDPIPH